MLQQFRRSRSLLRVYLECLGKVIREDSRQILGICDLRRPIRRNKVERLERVLIQVGRLSFNHFYSQFNTVAWKQGRDAPIAMIPKLQISTLGPYSLRVTTSGAIQYGVPTIVVRFECASEICAQKPKSARVRH